VELIIVLIIILILFGSSRLPEVGKGIGKAISSFKRGFSENKKAGSKNKNEVSEVVKEKEK
jgi:sec-independent protein translocase protein TatA